MLPSAAFRSRESTPPPPSPFAGFHSPFGLTDIVGLAFLNDPTLAPVDSPHGRIEFVQAFGITQTEVDALKGKTRICLTAGSSVSNGGNRAAG